MYKLCILQNQWQLASNQWRFATDDGPILMLYMVLCNRISTTIFKLWANILQRIFGIPIHCLHLPALLSKHCFLILSTPTQWFYILLFQVDCQLLETSFTWVTEHCARCRFWVTVAEVPRPKCRWFTICHTEVWNTSSTVSQLAFIVGQRERTSERPQQHWQNL